VLAHVEEHTPPEPAPEPEDDGTWDLDDIEKELRP
jgi:hypothetical protein